MLMLALPQQAHAEWSFWKKITSMVGFFSIKNYFPLFMPYFEKLMKTEKEKNEKAFGDLRREREGYISELQSTINSLDKKIVGVNTTLVAIQSEQKAADAERNRIFKEIESKIRTVQTELEKNIELRNEQEKKEIGKLMDSVENDIERHKRNQQEQNLRFMRQTLANLAADKARNRLLKQALKHNKRTESSKEEKPLIENPKLLLKNFPARFGALHQKSNVPGVIPS
jgi:hypothetical protein